MAVTLFHREIIIIHNHVVIRNGVKKKEEKKPIIEKPKPLIFTAKIRGKSYGRRNVNKQN